MITIKAIAEKVGKSPEQIAVYRLRLNVGQKVGGVWILTEQEAERVIEIARNAKRGNPDIQNLRAKTLQKKG